MSGAAAGPTFIAVGGIHGNEPAGAQALTRVASALAAEPSRVLRGDFVALAGNLSALSARRRYIDDDLNRLFDDVPRPPGLTESRERRELQDAIEEALSRARGPVVLLDLHTTSGFGGPFAVFADTIASRNFARRFPIPVVLGLEEQLAGTLVDFIGMRGHVAVGFEGGQHDDPRSVDVLEAIVWLALEEIGLVAEARPESRALLADGAAKAPDVVEIVYRHPVVPSDGFRMLPGFRSFQAVERGDVLAHDVRGEVRAPAGGLLLMPLYQQQGSEGFFIVERVHPFWLWVSAALRHTRAGRIVHWLPGIARMDEVTDLVRVNRKVARWYSLEILHLLGFRRRAEDGEFLIMERRAHDLP